MTFFLDILSLFSAGNTRTSVITRDRDIDRFLAGLLETRGPVASTFLATDSVFLARPRDDGFCTSAGGAGGATSFGNFYRLFVLERTMGAK